jgi:hypothetical protein
MNSSFVAELELLIDQPSFTFFISVRKTFKIDISTILSFQCRFLWFQDRKANWFIEFEFQFLCGYKYRLNPNLTHYPQVISSRILVLL